MTAFSALITDSSTIGTGDAWPRPGRFDYADPGNPDWRGRADQIAAMPVLHNRIAYQRGRDEWTDNSDRDPILRYATPGYLLFNHRTRAVGEADGRAIQIASLHGLTPETETSTRYFFYTANNLAADEQRRAEFTETCADALPGQGIDFESNEAHAGWRSRGRITRTGIAHG